MSAVLGAPHAPRTPSLRARRREEALARLLEIVRTRLEAGATFAELSVEELAGAAGLSRTTFYVYFEDKGDLLRAWFRQVTDELNRAAQAWWSIPGRPDRKTLHKALATIVETYRPHIALMAATHDAVGTDPGTRRLVHDAMTEYVDGLGAHISDGQARGTIDPALPPAETAYWLQWMAERGLHQLPLDADAAAIDRLVEAYTAIVWNTLYAPVTR